MEKDNILNQNIQVEPDMLVILNNEYTRLVNLTSTRTRNALMRVPIQEIVYRYLPGAADPLRVRGIGLGNVGDFLSIISQMKSFLMQLLNGRIDCVERDLLLKSAIYKINFDEFSKEFYRRNNHLPFFHVAECMLRNAYADRDCSIFIDGHKIFNQSPVKTKSIIASERGLSYERVRFIHSIYRRTLMDLDVSQAKRMKHPSLRAFISIVLNNDEWRYLACDFADCTEPDTETLCRHLRNENCEFHADYARELVKSLMLRHEGANLN